MKKFTLLVIIASTLLASCQKNNSSVPDGDKNVPGGFASKNLAPITTNVYITGTMKPTDSSIFVVPVYWKNGVANLIPHRGDAEAPAIAVSGDDVYLAGHDLGPGGKIQPCYWKNGVEHLLPVPNNFTGSADGIAVRANNVYVVGSYTTHDGTESTRAMLWKNGVGTSLAFNKEDSKATGIALDGRDVYVSGDATFNGISCAVYWKNTTWHAFAGTTQNSHATGIAVDSHDNFYISGSGASTAGYWKSANFRSLPDETGVPTSIAISNEDVYVGGQKGQEPVYWKNGQAVSLTVPASNSGGVQAIAVSGSNVYTTIFYFGVMSAPAYAYYKNTTIVQNLTNATAVFGMTVARR